MTNHQHHHQHTVCVQRKCISSSLPLSSPSPTDHQGLIVQHQAGCVLQHHEVIGKNTHSRGIKKALFPLEHRNFFGRVQKPQETDLYSVPGCIPYYCGELIDTLLSICGDLFISLQFYRIVIVISLITITHC